ncbi:unnamed protein product [Linum trigynum]|uniref:Uncharacterized protein n=1 Tax=Linum trigynum TaxID=586398 RepID=A0AAV2GQR9_9ROSI
MENHDIFSLSASSPGQDPPRPDKAQTIVPLSVEDLVRIAASKFVQSRSNDTPPFDHQLSEDESESVELAHLLFEAADKVGDRIFDSSSSAIAYSSKIVVAIEGRERIIRNMKVDVWRTYFQRYGMWEAELSRSYEAELVTKRLSSWSTCTVGMDVEVTIGSDSWIRRLDWWIHGLNGLDPMDWWIHGLVD